MSRFTIRSLVLAMAFVPAMLCVPPAHAVLGSTDATVMADGVHLRARMRSTSNATHTMRQLTLPNGGTVNEYVNPAGQVFAVTWDGPGKPDLRTLLGRHFDTMQADNAGMGRRGRRRPAVVNRADVLIQNGGHPGHFWGTAYLPHLAPTGFSLDDLQGA